MVWQGGRETGGQGVGGAGGAGRPSARTGSPQGTWSPNLPARGGTSATAMAPLLSPRQVPFPRSEGEAWRSRPPQPRPGRARPACGGLRVGASARTRKGVTESSRSPRTRPPLRACRRA